MKNSIFLVVGLLSLIGFSCNSDENIDPNYPTTISALTEIELNQLIGQIAQTPFAYCSAIDTFGNFMPILENELCLDSAWRANYSTSQLSIIAKEAIVEYGSFLGLTDSSLFQVKSIVTNEGIDYQKFNELYPDSFPLVWIIHSKNQTYNNLEIRGTTLSMVVSPMGVVALGGKWYDPVYIPATEIFDEDSAKTILTNVTLDYNSSKMTITSNTNWHNSKKVIVALKRWEKKELRVCWALYPETWEVIIDTQTGEQLSAINIEKL